MLNFKYKEALAEIKNLIQNMNTSCFYKDFECYDCDMKTNCSQDVKSKVLDIIKKVESSETTRKE